MKQTRLTSMLAVSLLLFPSLITQGALVMEPCPSNVPENVPNFNVTCRGMGASHTVLWTYSKDGVGRDIGTCGPDSPCVPYLGSLIDVTRPRSDVTTLTFRSVKRTNYGEVGCAVFNSSTLQVVDQITCPLDIVYNADVSSCDVSVGVTQAGSLIVNGSCVIDKVFSALGAYSCSIVQTLQNGTERTISTVAYTPTLSGSPEFGSGVCSVSASLQAEPSKYTIILNPAATQLHPNASYQSFLPQEPPTLHCTPIYGNYVMQNETLTCTCTASDLGQPQGRLVGYHGNALLVSGDYGNSELAFPGISVGADDVNFEARCDVTFNWTSRVVAGSMVSMKVSHGPQIVSLTAGNMSADALTFNETDNATLSVVCTALGTPAPDLTIFKHGIALVNKTSSGIFGSVGESSNVVVTEVVLQSENSGVYSCLAENMAGSDLANISLYIQCPPSITDYGWVVNGVPELNPPIYMTSLFFEIRAAPAPSSFSFYRLTAQTTATTTPTTTTTTTATTTAATISPSNETRSTVGHALNETTKTSSSGSDKTTSTPTHTIGTSISTTRSVATTAVTPNALTNSTSTSTLSPDMTVTRQDKLPAEGLFDVTCSPAAIFPRHDCVIAVVNATREDEGKYGLDLGNDLGQVRFEFLLAFDALTSPQSSTQVYGNNSSSSQMVGEDNETWVVAVAAAVSAVVVVVVIVIVVVVCMRRRRSKGGLPDGEARLVYDPTSDDPHRYSIAGCDKPDSMRPQPGRAGENDYQSVHFAAARESNVYHTVDDNATNGKREFRNRVFVKDKSGAKGQGGQCKENGYLEPVKMTNVPVENGRESHVYDEVANGHQERRNRVFVKDKSAAKGQGAQCKQNEYLEPVKITNVPSENGPESPVYHEVNANDVRDVGEVEPHVYDTAADSGPGLDVGKVEPHVYDTAADSGPGLVSASNPLYEEVSNAARKQNKVKVPKVKVKVQEDKVKVQEDKVKVQEDKVKVQEDKVKVQEDKVKVQEDKVKVQEENAYLEPVSKRTTKPQAQQDRESHVYHTADDVEKDIGDVGEVKPHVYDTAADSGPGLVSASNPLYEEVSNAARKQSKVKVQEVKVPEDKVKVHKVKVQEDKVKVHENKVKVQEENAYLEPVTKRQTKPQDRESHVYHTADDVEKDIGGGSDVPHFETDSSTLYATPKRQN